MIDVAVIGLGVVGAAVLRELRRYTLDVMGLDGAHSFAAGTTRANSGIVHAGHDAVPGTQKARFNLEGNRLYDTWAAELEFPLRRIGAMVLCHAGEDESAIEELYQRGTENHVPGMEVLDAQKVHELEPNLRGDIKAALLSTSSGITSPYEFCIASAENARNNGAVLQYNDGVWMIERVPGGYKLYTDKGTVLTKTVVNAAGLYADEISNMVCEKKVHITPRKGEYMLLDNTSGAFFKHTLFSLPNEMGKGILISPTVDGNLLLGPTSHDVVDKGDTATTVEGQREVLEKVAKNWDVPKNRIITQFAGIRAHLAETDDFLVGECADGFYNAVGIESPGLTAAPAIAVYLSCMVAQKLCAQPNTAFDPHRKRIRAFREMDDAQRMQAIAENPQYANMVCRCEKVTEAEVVEAIRRGARTMDDVKQYTRAGMGNCQRGFCGPDILEILARELGVDKTEVLLNEAGTNILYAKIR